MAINRKFNTALKNIFTMDYKPDGTIIVEFLKIKISSKFLGRLIKSIHCKAYIANSAVIEEDVYIASDVCIQDECRIGKKSSIAANSSMSSKTIIGRYCSIASNVHLGVGQHPIDSLSMSQNLYCNYCNVKFEEYPGKVIFEEGDTKKHIQLSKPVIIGNDVWIGRNVLVMDGVKIGDGAVIGAGAVVTKDIPSYAVAVGVPARVVKYRFSSVIIERLLNLKWWELDESLLQNLPYNIEQCIDLLNERIYNYNSEQLGAYD